LAAPREATAAFAGRSPETARELRSNVRPAPAAFRDRRYDRSDVVEPFAPEWMDLSWPS
jgi:hypothetical protein